MNNVIHGRHTSTMLYMAGIHPQCYTWQAYIHNVPVILYDNFQCESHKHYVPPTIVTWLQLLRKQTNTGTSTALTAETRWLRTRFRALSRLVTSS
jgi:hypothetical protein